KKMTNDKKQNTSTGQAPKKVGDFIDGAEDLNKKDGLGENINAAHWPTDSAGQYKGEPFSTDYGKLKAKNTTKSDTTASTASASPEGDNEIKPDNA
ncbi:hypothetical protein, partial [Escherichia coli]|uniref:hypothetical protein n=1 Tax=Escherichia coli TaxID=562 RepID=UPI0013B4249A